MERPNFYEYTILDAIEEYIHKNGQSPTIEELSDITGLGVNSTICKRLESLKNKGYIDIKPRTKRGIILKK